MSGASNALDPVSDGALRPIVYDIEKEAVAVLAQKYAGLQADTAEGYEEVRLAIADVRGKRTAVEKRRKELKAEALEFGRKVDGAAGVLTDALLAIEEPLKVKRDAVDEARENAKKAAEKAEMLALQAKIKADQEAEDARLTKEREAHAAERAAFEAVQAAADKKRQEEQAALDAQKAEVAAAQRKLDEDKAASARVEADRVAAAQAEAEAKVAAERAQAEAARLEALRPEIERVRAWADTVRAFGIESAPEVESRDASMCVDWAKAQIENVARVLEKFTPRRA